MQIGLAISKQPKLHFAYGYQQKDRWLTHSFQPYYHLQGIIIHNDRQYYKKFYFCLLGECSVCQKTKLQLEQHRKSQFWVLFKKIKETKKMNGFCIFKLCRHWLIKKVFYLVRSTTTLIKTVLQ